MKKQIIRVSPFQTAKISALMYFIVSLPFVAFMAISFAFSPMPQMGMGFLLLVPIIYLVLGFIFTIIGAWVYNLVAGWVGGIEYTAVEIVPT